jgi:enediyne biosynthesis protein E7
MRMMRDIMGFLSRAEMPPRAPGPAGHLLFGHLREFRRDVLGLLMSAARAHGDVVRFRLGPRVVHLLNHPDHAQHVLLRHASNYDKRTRSTAFIKGVTGESLLTANGDYWSRQRRLMQPAFHREQIAHFIGPMVSATEEMLERWRARPVTGAPVDVAEEMSRLTYVIVGSTLFSADVGPDADAINEAMTVVLPHVFGQLGRVWNWPAWLPTTENRRFRQALAQVDATVFRIIAAHRRSLESGGAPPRDLLGLLMLARDEGSGEGLSDQQLRNESTTFLLAGHETTANALTWTLHLLSHHPAVAHAVRAEVRTVLAGRSPTLDDVPRLTLTRRVIMEAMRLFPPIWILERRVIKDDTVGGYHLPAGSSVVVSPYAMHRHPAFWSEPERFCPERFDQPPPSAYLPFGAGPRFCIGREFALLEAQIVTALIVRAIDLTPVPGAPIEPWPGITLRTRHGLPMQLRPAS